MDLRIFPNEAVVPIVGTIEEAGDTEVTFLAKKPRSQTRTRMVIPADDIGWAIYGGSKLDNHPDVLWVRPSAFRQEPATYIKNVDVKQGEDRRTFESGNRSVVVFNGALARVSCQEDVKTEAQQKKEPKAARAKGKSKRAAAKKAAKKSPLRKARKRQEAADDFED